MALCCIWQKSTGNVLHYVPMQFSRVSVSQETNKPANQSFIHPKHTYKYNCWRHFISHSEQLPDELRSVAQVFLYELRSNDPQESRRSGIRNCLAQQSLASTRGTIQYYALHAMRFYVKNARPQLSFTYKGGERQGQTAASHEVERQVTRWKHSITPTSVDCI